MHCILIYCCLSIDFIKNKLLTNNSWILLLLYIENKQVAVQQSVTCL